MNRVEVLQRIIDKTRAHTYLEIGVEAGDCFLQIKARRKFAVDPNFNITTEKKIKWMVRNIFNVTARYYQSTSDGFFAKFNTNKGLDVVFVDGLHTYQQSLKDVQNALDCLRKGGVIIMHDCNPPNEVAAIPADFYDYRTLSSLPGWSGEWCGDVWKTICYLRSSRDDLNVFVLDCDRGLGIITRGKPETRLELTEEKLDRLTYDDLAKNRAAFLNLKDESFLFQFLNSTDLGRHQRSRHG